MIFDRSRLKLLPLAEREHDLHIGFLLPLEPKPVVSPAVADAARAIVSSRKNGKEVILMMGGHVIRSGAQKYIIDLIENGFITCVAMNGSCMIHDFELSLIGATTESVARYIKNGEFGFWRETSRINDIINHAYKTGKNGGGMGAAMGKEIFEGNYPYKDISILAACHQRNVPATMHISIGSDIIHQMPNCDGAATGALSYHDFLLFAKRIENLEGGVVANFGSAVTAPEVFLKALSMARNAARQEGREINRFTTLVCDLHALPSDFRSEPPKDSAAYYFRPWKTMLVRTVADGGTSLYQQGRHAETIPALWTAIRDAVHTP